MLATTIVFEVVPPEGCQCHRERALAAGRRPGVQTTYAIPAAFVHNAGQWSTRAAFVANAPGIQLGVTATALDIALAGDVGSSGCLVRCAAVAADPRACIRGEAVLPGMRNFFLGTDASRWRMEVAAFASVRCENVWPGIGLRVRHHGGRLEYDVLLASGSDASQIRFRVDGATALRVLEDGALEIATPAGTLVMSTPRTWQIAADGSERAISCRHALRGQQEFGFDLAAHDAALATVIDPGLLYSTYFGGSSFERASAVALDAQGGVTIVGNTMSADLPTTPGAFDQSYNGTATVPFSAGDAYAARFNADGQLVWATYVGGADNEEANALDVLPTGEVFFAGWTSSTDYPTTAGAFDRTFNGIGLGTIYGGGDCYVTRLAADGSALGYSTYVGGNDLEYVLSLDLQPDGACTIAGHVHSLDYPVTPGAVIPALRGYSDAFVTRLDPAGATLLFSTYYGGIYGEEYPFGLGIDAVGNTVIAGPTDSPTHPITPGVVQPNYLGGVLHFAETFVASIAPDGRSLRYVTYLGSPGDETTFALSVAPDGTAVVAGETNSPLFPTTATAWQRTLAGGFDAFVARLSPTGDTLLASTMLGGGNRDAIFAVAADGAGGAVVLGGTESVDFPTTPGATARAHVGSEDVVVARLGPDFTTVDYATFLPGASWDHGYGLALAPDGSAWLAAVSFSPDFPTTPSAHLRIANGGDGVLVHHSLLPDSCERFGAGTTGCAGMPTIAVNSWPQIGNPTFAFTGARMGGSTVAVAAIGLQRLVVPIGLFGIDVWIAPAAPTELFFAFTSAHGGAVVPLPIPAISALVGLPVYAQWAVLDACAPLGFAASGALAAVLVP